jgi:hypothetical protein
MQVGVRRPIAVWVSVQLAQWDAWYDSRPGQGKGGGRPPGRASRPGQDAEEEDGGV